MSTTNHDPQGAKSWRGIFAIPPAPFDSQGDIDLDGLRRVVEFSVAAGAHGIVHPVMVSEFSVLSDAERLEMIPVVTRTVDGRCPAVIGVSGVCTQAAVTFTQTAVLHGADAVIAMPPYALRYCDDDVIRHFEAISAAANGPVMIQNADGYNSLGRDLLLKITREVEHVHFLKEEVPPGEHSIGAITDANEPEVWGVFGGGGCKNLFREMRRGAVGNMAAAEFTDIYVRMFNMYESGDTVAAEQLHRRLMPLIERSGPSKEVFVLRGVLECDTRRALGKPFDDKDRQERDRFWSELEAEFSL